MLKKILIANRGEIACRIARTAAKMGIATVAVYSDADAKALHAHACDEAIHIGPSPATGSYLRIDKIIAAAKSRGADAIHPGYGFLSENPELPEACTAAGIVFIGPTAEAMRALGGKAAAKEIAIKAGVPVVPGYQGDKQDARTLAKEAAKVGYPVMIKAVAGGGGRGMRLVEAEAQLPELLDSAQREAQSAFGNAHVLLEKVVVRPRHIEVQVFGDTHGNVVHMFERDCTLQRRNQKVIEEAPAPGMSAALREKMCAAAVKLAKAVGYTGAGTVEFLVEGGTLDESAKWYFIEMNTRLQVEHPVTEEITGLDLVEWQFRVAAGEKLPLKQADIKMSGHAVEVRLCAEDPASGFMPSIGEISLWQINAKPENVRLETGVQQGSSISPFYDSMIAKLISHAPGRATAIARLNAALDAIWIGGIKTNAEFLDRLLANDDVAAARMDTGFIARHIDGLTRFVLSPEAHRPAVAHFLMPRTDVNRTTVSRNRPWDKRDGFSLAGPRRQRVRLLLDGVPHDFAVTWAHDGLHFGDGSTAEVSATPMLRHAREDAEVLYSRQGLVPISIAWPTYDASEIENGAATGSIRAPINGRVAKLFVAAGAKVAKGDKIVVVEAMKMEHVIAAAIDGTVDNIAVSEGAQVNQGALLAHIAVAT